MKYDILINCHFDTQQIFKKNYQYSMEYLLLRPGRHLPSKPRDHFMLGWAHHLPAWNWTQLHSRGGLPYGLMHHLPGWNQAPTP